MPARRSIQAIAVTAVALVAALGAGYAPAHALANGVLLRDVRTGFDLLGSQSQPATPSDYIQPDTQIEPSIAVNPNNPLNVVTGYQEGRVAGGGDATNGFATSLTGGQSWTYGEIPGLTSYPGQTGPFDRASDAVVAFGPNNDVYYSSLVFDDTSANGLRSGMAVNVSKNGGVTWSQPVFFADDMIGVPTIGGLNDKNWVVVDNSDAPGHHKGRVYIVWDRIVSMYYDYCDANCDQLSGWAIGGTFFQLAVLPGYTGQVLGAFPVVLPSGSLAVIFNAAAGGLPTGVATDQSVITSAGGSIVTCVVAQSAGSIPSGAPLVWGPPVSISANQSNPPRSQRAAGLIAVDVDTKTGAIYAVWDDARNHSEAYPVNDIVLSKSTDSGVTWSVPAKVDPSTATDQVDRFNPGIAVGTDGVIHVGYRSRVEADDAAKMSPAIDTYYQESSDGGTTWTKPLRVNLVADDARYGAFSRLGTFQGDYDQVATAGPYTYVVRAESYPVTSGEPVALTPDASFGTSGQLALTDAGKAHQHQRVWVAVIGPAQAGGTVQTSAGQPGEGALAGGTPNSSAVSVDRGWIGLLGVVGVAATGAMAAARRRRRRRVPG